MGFKKVDVPSLKLPDGVDVLMQTYEKQELPDGVIVMKNNIFPDDWGGTFKEMIRLDEKGCVMALKEQGIDFKIRQVSMSILPPRKKMFWHLHPDRNNRPGQSEMWFVNSMLLMGIIDLRKDSSTYGMKTKIVVTPDKIVYLPVGLAHGAYNPTDTASTLIYFMDRQFEPTDDTQECRIDPDKLPYDFVVPDVI